MAVRTGPEACGLEQSKPVKALGQEEKKSENEENARKMDRTKATEYRAMTARANYLAQGRVDLQYT